MSLYTRTGDAGRTDLANGMRVDKDDPRPEAYGTLDELDSHLGLARCICKDEELRSRLATIQRDLFILGSELAMGVVAPDQPHSAATQDAIRRLEQWIDQSCAAVPTLSHFILPGGVELACRLHVARTVCRRAERRIVTLSKVVPVSDHTKQYINRLSDLLFAWARQVNHVSGQDDVEVDINR